MSEMLPPISKKGKILFIGSAFPPSPGGSMVVMRELLRNFAPESFEIIAPRYYGCGGGSAEPSKIFRIGATRLRPSRFAAWLRLLQVPFMVKKAVWYARQQGVVAIVAPYPSLDMLLLALLVAKRLSLPFFPYLHDTIVEALEKTSLRQVARVVQGKVFEMAKKIMVMSDGMAALYKTKYHLDCVPIRHTYREPIRATPNECNERSLFCAGNIYGVNDKALIRVMRVASRLEIKTEIATLSESVREYVLKLRSEGVLVDAVGYPDRPAYIEAVASHGINLLALNDAKDSDWGDEELATAFPTKTAEYLASGRPILVICPERYSLSKYFREHRCGKVISPSCSDSEIEQAIVQLLANGAEVQLMCQNAIRQAHDFAAEQIARTFSETIDAYMQSPHGGNDDSNVSPNT